MILRENPGVQAILNALPPNLNARAEGDVVSAQAPESQWVFRSVWIGEGFPGDLDRAEFNSEFTNEPDIVPVVTARRVSPGTRKLLDARDLSWADLTGKARIYAPPGFLIERLPAKASKAAPALIRWSDSMGAVAETLLHLRSRSGHSRREDTGEQIYAEQLANLTSYSYPQVNKVLQELESAGFVTKIGTERGRSAQRYLREPSNLLSAWAGWHKDRTSKAVEIQTLWRDANQSLARIKAEAAGAWAVTGWMGADLLAPFSTAVPNVTCYVESPFFEKTVNRLLRADDVELVMEHGRISVARAERHLMRLANLDSDPPVVSPIRVYGDLLRIGGRGEEAAQHLREVAIGY